MTFKDQYPDFATIEEHIRRARPDPPESRSA
jgi:hypothetical protein